MSLPENLDKEFGIGGAASYGVWFERFEEARREEKFGNSEKDPYLPLKQDIVKTLMKYHKKRRMWMKGPLIASIAFLVICALSAFSVSGSGVVNGEIVVIAFACLPLVLVLWRKRVCEQYIYAANHFDKTYLDGMIGYCLQHNLPLDMKAKN